jgi:hypothetical protein
MGTGALMMLGSLGLGLVCGLIVLATGRLFIYLAVATIILFFAGLGTVFKGLMGRSD